eukprot:Opistho-2@36743
MADQFEVIGEDLANNPNAGYDATADFLAREQEELAAFGIAPGQAEFPTDNVDQGFDAFGGEQQQNFYTEAPADEAGGFDAFGDAPAAPAAPEEPEDRYSFVSQVDQSMGEPRAIKEWRAQRESQLATKDTQEKSQVDALFSKGKSDLSEWYQRYEEQKGKTRSTNREAERAFVAERDEVIPGGEWERIARLVDFNPKGTKNSKDTSRLRSILLQLKQTPLVR